MGAISLKLRGNLLKTRLRLRATRLTEVSQKVRKESMRINAEFAAVERDPDA